MRIEVHIERLVLVGLPVASADAPRVGAAVEAELARLFATADLKSEFVAKGAVPRVSAPPISVGPGARPDAIGRALARSVHRGISGTAAPMPNAHADHDQGRATP